MSVGNHCSTCVVASFTMANSLGMVIYVTFAPFFIVNQSTLHTLQQYGQVVTTLMGIRGSQQDEHEAPREVMLQGLSKPDVTAITFSPHHDESTQSRTSSCRKYFLFSRLSACRSANETFSANVSLLTIGPFCTTMINPFPSETPRGYHLSKVSHLKDACAPGFAAC